MKVLLILCLILCGCSKKENKPEENKSLYKDGLYETSGEGYGGKILVTTSFADGTLNDIIVKEHYETPSIGGVAIEQLIKDIKEKKDYNVDVVSGATLSSNGLKEAVKEAFEQAKNK